MKSYLKFNYKSICEKELNKLLNLNKIIGTAKFLRSEYAFRKNYTESHTVLNSLNTGNPSLTYNLIKFLEYYFLRNDDMIIYKTLNSFSFLVKKEQELKAKIIKLPWKLKIYFVNGKIMTEEEYHEYRDGMYITST